MKPIKFPISAKDGKEIRKAIGDRLLGDAPSVQ
jgi:hypothetical protein